MSEPTKVYVLTIDTIDDIIGVYSTLATLTAKLERSKYPRWRVWTYEVDKPEKERGARP